jgi:hypothetical protein
MREQLVTKAVFHYGEFVREDLEKFIYVLYERAIEGIQKPTPSKNSNAYLSLIAN